MTTFSRRSKSRPRFVRRTPRILTVVPICDGHDSAIVTINFEFARHGIEVIYLGYHRSVRDIVRAAVQEDVRAIGLSSYNGGHIEFFTDVLRMLHREGAGHISLFGGGGGTITPGDAQVLKRRGVEEIFFAGTPLNKIVQFVQSSYGMPQPILSPRALTAQRNDLKISRLLSASVAGTRRSASDSELPTLTIGISGPGG